MIFTEIEPVEAFDLRTFESLPLHRWQAGIIRMLFGKYRVGISLKNSHTYTVSYWGGDLGMASLLCANVLGICSWLPEEISPQELVRVFPIQKGKDLSTGFLKSLSDAGALARSRAQAQN
jgi:hypothetical protein